MNKQLRQALHLDSACSSFCINLVWFLVESKILNKSETLTAKNTNVVDN